MNPLIIIPASITAGFILGKYASRSAQYVWNHRPQLQLGSKAKAAWSNRPVISISKRVK